MMSEKKYSRWKRLLINGEIVKLEQGESYVRIAKSSKELLWANLYGQLGTPFLGNYRLI